MPLYKVLEKGFFDGVTYDPNGKRKMLETDKPFKVCPMWLEAVKGETPQQKAARTKAANKAKEEAEAKAKQDAIDVAAVTFTESAEQTTKTL